MGSSRYSRLPYFAAMLLPWPLFTISLGVDLTWYKLMPIFMIVITLLTKRSIRVSRSIFWVTILSSIYLILTTIINYWIILSDGEFIDLDSIAFGLDFWLKTAAVQVFFAISIFSQIMFFQNIATKTGIANRVLNGYIDGCMVSVAAGLAFLVLFGEIRMTGLSEEPRHFSAVLVPAIFAILVNSTGRLFRLNYARLKLAILSIGLVLSMSTSSVVACLVGVVVFLLFSSVRFVKKLAVLISAVMFIVLVLNVPYVEEFFEARNQGRQVSLDLILYFVPKDALALYFLTENWIYMFFGTGAGAITLHTMQPEFLYSLSNPYLLKTNILSGVLEGKLEAVLAPSSFIISYVAYFGVLGLLLLVLLVNVMIQGVIDSGLRASVMLFAVMVFCACLVLSSIGGAISIFFLAVFYAEAKAREQKL